MPPPEDPRRAFARRTPTHPRTPHARARRPALAFVLGLAVAAVIGLGPGGLLGSGGTAGAATQVPCSSIGGGKYDCQFYPAGNGYSGAAPPGPGRESHLSVVVAYRWQLNGLRTRLVCLRLRRVAARVLVSIRCTPAGRCPGTGGSLPPRVAARRLARIDRGGTVLRLAFHRTGDVTEVVRVRFRSGRRPIGRLIAH